VGDKVRGRAARELLVVAGQICNVSQLTLLPTGTVPPAFKTHHGFYISIIHGLLADKEQCSAAYASTFLHLILAP
jgi:hypothetical protein